MGRIVPIGMHDYVLVYSIHIKELIQVVHDKVHDFCRGIIMCSNVEFYLASINKGPPLPTSNLWRVQIFWRGADKDISRYEIK
jgi:hypothetical protein